MRLQSKNPDNSASQGGWPAPEFFNLFPDAVVGVDRNGIIRQINEQLNLMFGYAAEELLGNAIEVLLPERLRERHVRNREGYQAGPSVRPMGGGLDLYGRRKDGTEFPVDIMLSPVPSGPGLILAVVRDVTHSVQLRDELRRVAFSDQLTGLPNRSALYSDMKQYFLPQLDRGQLSIALFDLDGFKEVNDLLGHSAGDELLKCVTQRWKGIREDGAKIYRLGGDEFVVVMARCGDPRRIAGLVGVMLTTLETPFEIFDKSVYVGASAGIAIAPRDGDSVDDLLAHVDLALYSAKAAGRGRFVFFQNSMRSEAEARRDIDLQLRAAYIDRDLKLYYQPQVRLEDGAFVGSEVLLRWHRGGTVVSPAAFIDNLEGSSLAPEVGNWILHSACEMAAAWREQGLMPGRVAVNLFPSQFHQPSFVAQVEKTLVDTNLPPDVLELEITENITLDLNSSLAKLHDLRSLGVGLALDDFGTGYGSLSYLTEMPLTHIKIDQSFIRGIPEQAKAVTIICSLIALAHNLGLFVIAEGVETREQADFLRAQGCDGAQGYFFAKPVAAPEFEALLRAPLLLPKQRSASTGPRRA